MLCSGVNFEFLDHLSTKGAFGKHPFNGVLDHKSRPLRAHFPGRPDGHATGVPAVPEVLLIRLLGARKTNLVRIDDDDEIARVNVWGKAWFMLPSENGRHARGETTYDLIFCVNYEPGALNIGRFGTDRLETVYVHRDSGAGKPVNNIFKVGRRLGAGGGPSQSHSRIKYAQSPDWSMFSGRKTRPDHFISYKTAALHSDQ